MGRYGFRRKLRKKRWPRRRWFYHKRWWRWFPYQKYRYPRRIHTTVIKQKAKNLKWIHCRGWEPLGINGTYIESKTQIGHVVNNNWQCKTFENFDCSKRSGVNYVDFCGGWGSASFSLASLLVRASAGLCEFSDDFTQYDSVRFVSITLWGVPAPDLDWVLVGTTHFSVNTNELNNYKKYSNPIYLMLKPKRLFTPSLKRSRKRLFYPRKFYAGSQFTNELYDKQFFVNKTFFTYNWSYIDLELPVGTPQNDAFYASLSGLNYKNEWYKDKKGSWLDREEYSNSRHVSPDSTLFSQWSAFITTVFNKVVDFFQGNEVKQAPGAPPILKAPTLQEASFFYHVKFQAAGRTIPALRGGSVAEIPRPSNPCPGQQSNFECSGCLGAGDISSGGTISSEAFRRITKSDHSSEFSDTNTGEEEEEDEDSSYSRLSESEEEGAPTYETLNTYLRKLIESRTSGGQ